MNLEPLEYESSTALNTNEIVNINIRDKALLGVVLKEVSKPSFECKTATSSNLSFSDKQIILANFIANYYCVNIGVAYSILTPKKQQDSTKNTNNPKIQTSSIILSAKQQKALEFIQSHKKTLLFGDTGSGKTEIYIKAILEILNEGGNIIFLMPEIALTPQMEMRLKSVFGNLVCIWHSKISDKKKNEILNKIDDFKIIVGARSALFLPIENIKLIIIDEEHDDAYKSTSAPRYNARDLAIYLSHISDIKLILGSATPSLNSFYHFSNNKEIFRLKGRHFNSQKHITFDSNLEILPPLALKKITNAIDNNKQVIVFVPLRGNFKIIMCKSCGSGIKCKYCSINMSYHSKKNALICHYCGFSEAFFPDKTSCKYCNKVDFQAFKTGTQEIAKQLQECIKNANIEIFDRDEIKTDSKLKKTLKKFNDKEIDILVGTQMISKGHDYHNVELVVILGIDILLNSYDFRAYERSVSLLHQISGRCGRKDDGEVYIQTLNTNFFRQFLDDYETFLHFELKNRESLYPPFTRLALICSQNSNDSKAKEILQNARKIVESHKNIEIVGLSRAPIEKINNKWRYFMLLRTNHTKELISVLHLLKNQPLIIDIDPLQIL